METLAAKAIPGSQMYAAISEGDRLMPCTSPDDSRGARRKPFLVHQISLFGRSELALRSLIAYNFASSYFSHALCSTRRRRGRIVGDALRPDSLPWSRSAGAVKGCNRLRHAHQRASLDGSEHRDTSVLIYRACRSPSAVVSGRNRCARRSASFGGHGFAEAEHTTTSPHAVQQQLAGVPEEACGSSTAKPLGTWHMHLRRFGRCPPRF
jgi:hypothetical protein